MELWSQDIQVPNLSRQENATSEASGAPDYYLNNSKIDLSKTFVNVKSIDSIVVEKETENGEIYLFSKDQDIVLITLVDLLKQHSDLDEMDDSLLFKIDGKYITDIDGLSIDESYFIYVNIIELTDMQYLSERHRALKIVEIELEEEERIPEIRVRG